MAIKEKGYAHWDGELSEQRFPWWPIARYGIKLTFKKKSFKPFFMVSFIPAVFFLAIIYVSERIQDFKFMIRDSSSFLKVDPKYFNTYFTNNSLLFIMVIMMIFCGAGLISDDLKHNSLQLYFSRPIKKKDYFIGKTAVIVFFLSLLTLVPGLIFFLMKLVFSGSLKFFLAYPWLPISIIGYSFILTAFFSFYTLLLSAINKNRRYVAILIIGIYLFSDIFYGIFYGNFHSQYFSLISLRADLQQVGAVIFNQKTPYNIPWIFSFLVLCAVCLLAAFVLKKKVKGVEVVK
jgi:ABC-type transport system involved in multi-copper enzyme maturation permease subunit